MAAKKAAERLESRVVVSTTRDLRDRLDAHCEREGIPLARFVRELIEQALEEGEDNADDSHPNK